MNTSNTRQANAPSFRIITLVLNEHQCNKFVRITKSDDFYGGIIMLGRGTVKSEILNLLGIKSEKKEIVSILADEKKAAELLDFYTKELELDKPGHGIAFTTEALVANRTIKEGLSGWGEAPAIGGESMYRKLTVVVNRGMAEDVMDIARKSGVTGGTILHGRGAGSDYSAKFLGMEIEPEKELVIILLPSEIVEKVANDIYTELKLDNPGTGILFVEPVLDVRGLKKPGK